MNKPTIEELQQWLTDSLASTFGTHYAKLEFLSQSEVDDGTTVFLLLDMMDRRQAVVLCSAPASPSMIHRAMDRASRAKQCLDGATGAPILDPILQGSVHGLSFAVLPYCRALSEYRPIWWVQRVLLRPSIFDWLLHVAQCTVSDAEHIAIDRNFTKPLQYLASLQHLSGHLREAALLASKRLAEGLWTPKHVLMHGDLWKGNILLKSQDNVWLRLRNLNHFAIIDWGGAEMDGYPMFDLIRLAHSLNLSRRKFKCEVKRHCHLLRCDQIDAISYLLAALGYTAINIENFPMDRYLQMTEACYTTLMTGLD